MSELTPFLRDALAECSRWSDRPDRIYWWRTASMQKLEALGFVETWTPEYLTRSRSKSRPYRVTAAGRHELARQP